MTPNTIQWAAQLQHVREVSLLGTADLGFWRQRLAAEDLSPAECDGLASVAIISASGKFAGVRFRELSVSVSLSAHDEKPGRGDESTETLPAYFLLRAFNSSRLFAWCERVFFSTPYEHAQVEIVDSLPCEFRVTQLRHTLLNASMSLLDADAGGRSVEVRDDSWMARILLPRGDETYRRSSRRMFYAKIQGTTHVYSFRAGQDRCELNDSAGTNVFGTLRQSQFAPVQWIVRTDARHAKSKTYGLY
jgi:hypothetical protein